jgi:hypothetical protein
MWCTLHRMRSRTVCGAYDHDHDVIDLIQSLMSFLHIKCRGGDCQERGCGVRGNTLTQLRIANNLTVLLYQRPIEIPWKCSSMGSTLLKFSINRRSRKRVLIRRNGPITMAFIYFLTLQVAERISPAHRAFKPRTSRIIY